jgi:hypothetical protein
MSSDYLLLISAGQDPGSEVKHDLMLTQRKNDRYQHLWTSGLPLAEAAPVIAACLRRQQILSAALVPADIQDDRLWVAHEWFGSFVVYETLTHLLGRISDLWDYHSATDELLILRPKNLGTTAKDRVEQTHRIETAREYAQSITGRQPVVVHTTLSAIRREMEAWFGDLADPRLGGAMALLSLSGATTRSDEIDLRNPAALRLKLQDNDLRLSSHIRSGRLIVSAYGYSKHAARDVAEKIPEILRTEAERSISVTRAERSAYAVLLLIEAPVDPELEIDDGSIFEQESVNDVQTLAAATPRRLTVSPGTYMPLAFPAWCLNSSLAAPSGESVRPTPLALITTGSTQDEVWAERASAFTGGET